MTDLATIGFKADTSELKGATADLKALEAQGKKTDKAVDDLGTTSEASGKKAGGMGLAWASVGTALVAAGGFALKAAGDFEKSVSELSAITGATGDQLEYLKNAARDIGRETSVSARDTVEAFKLMASARPELLENAEALQETTRQAIMLAEAAGITLTDATTTVGTSLSQFGASADEAARFVNVLAAGAKFGASEIVDTSMALKNSGAAANAAGVSFEAANAAIQALAAGGIKAGEAGTGLRNIILKLEASTDENLRPSVVGLTTALGNLAAENLGLIELTEKFGIENVVAAQTLVDQSGALKELETNLTGTQTAIEQATTNTNNLNTAWSNAGDAIVDVGISIGSFLAPAATAALEAFTTLATGLAVAMEGFEGSEQRAAGLRSELDKLTVSQIAANKAIAESELEAALSALAREKATKDRSASDARAYKIQEDRVAEVTERIELYDKALRDATNANGEVSDRANEAASSLDKQGESATSTADGVRELTEEEKKHAEEVANARAKVDEMIVAQKTELAQLQMTDLQREISNALIEAGADRTGEQTVAIIENETALYNQKAALDAATAASNLGVASADAYAKAQMDAFAKTQKAAIDAAQKSDEEWGLFRNSMSDFFADLMMEGGNAWDNLAKSAERAIYKMVGDVATSGLLSLLTGEKFDLGTVLGNSGTGGKVLGGVLDILGSGSGGNPKGEGGKGGVGDLGNLGSIANIGSKIGGMFEAGGLFGPAASVSLAGGGTALTEAGYLSLMSGGGGAAAGAGAAGAAGGIGSMVSGVGTAVSAGMSAIGGAASAAGSAIMTGLAAVPVWGWVAAGVAAIASQIDKSTPSYNAGILLHDVPGVSDDRKFDIDPFASGLAPVGFNRRISEEEASKVIDSFREYDALVTGLATRAGVTTSASELQQALNAIALNERGEGKGTGVFLGVGGESGGGQGATLESQLNDYVRAYFSTFTDELDASVADYIMGGQTATDMITRAAERIPEPQEDAEAAARNEQNRAQDMAMQEKMLDALTSMSSTLQSLAAAIANNQTNTQESAGAFADVVAEFGAVVQGLQRNYRPELT